MEDYILLDDHTNLPCDAVKSLFGQRGQPAPTIFGRWNGMDLVYDARLVLETNTVENPLPDGGGTAVLETNGQMTCSNAPRSFINEDHCVLSTAETACSSEVPSVRTVKLDSRISRGSQSLLQTSMHSWIFQSPTQHMSTRLVLLNPI